SLFKNTKGSQSTQSRKRKQPERADNVTPPTSGKPSPTTYQEIDSASTVESDQESVKKKLHTITIR
ncbi:6885_t:CDS:1, partial [Paraglomus occultum]